MRISFFPKQRYKRFQYRPRFYQPVREEREARMKRMGIETEDQQTDNRYGSFDGRSRSKIDPAKERAATIRLMVLFLILLLIACFFYVKK